jgi:hypothetical protein
MTGIWSSFSGFFFILGASKNPRFSGFAAGAIFGGSNVLEGGLPRAAAATSSRLVLFSGLMKSSRFNLPVPFLASERGKGMQRGSMLS